MRFTRDQIRAAVDSGRLSDPRAAAWLTDALIARQRITARYWFERVNPLDDFAADREAVCFKDLSIVYAFVSPGTTRYTVDYLDGAGKSVARVQLAAASSGVSCAKLELSRTSGDGYTIAKITTTRPAFTGSTYVHLARDPVTHAPRVIGIWRP